MGGRGRIFSDGCDLPDEDLNDQLLSNLMLCICVSEAPPVGAAIGIVGATCFGRVRGVPRSIFPAAHDGCISGKVRYFRLNPYVLFR